MRNRPTVSSLVCLVLAGAFVVATAAETGFATIDGVPVSYEEFERMVYSEARQKFYHSQPENEAVYLAFRRDVANKLVDRKLKLREARARGMKADAQRIELQLAEYEAQYGGTPRWEEESDAMLETLRVYFEEEGLLEQIDAVLREVDGPDESQLRAFYEQNLDKFTEPEQVRLSVILLPVPAWADGATWDAARAEAGAIADKIEDGLPFAEAARRHSSDPSAENGGDIGFVHAGVLEGELLSVVNQLQDGEMAADPVTVLEGIVLVRVEGRRPQQVHALDEVRERAAGLWRRDAEQTAYEARVAELRGASDIVLDEAYLEKLPD